ncbi:hypothetical protein [Tessaracoccus sp.]
MSDRQFERPGVPPRLKPTNWPYHPPTPEAPPQSWLEADAPESGAAADPGADELRRRWFRLLVVAVLSAMLGAVVGGVWVAQMLDTPPQPEPVPITLDAFPRELFGAQRNDIKYREKGYPPTVERLDTEFQKQLAAHRFSYGGDGATLNYGLLFELSIVNGLLAPDPPRDGIVDQNGRATERRRLLLLHSGEMSCTFEPEFVTNTKSGIDELGDFMSDGRTTCVMVDTVRHLSLRIAHVRDARDVDAFDAATSFRDELLILHANLTG